MGFRDLHVFNKALPAKQGWRLLSNPESLMARIFKEKSYPSGSFMEAKIGSRPSHAWRSLCQAREVLELGIGWRVGNGTSIRIWGDAWLPDPYPRFFSPPNPALPLDARVIVLLLNDSGGWNYELIHRIFDPEDVARICSVMVSPLGQLDWLVWRGVADGAFSVKTTYHLAMTIRAKEMGECSREAADL
jgi:hypothetical protein